MSKTLQKSGLKNKILITEKEIQAKAKEIGKIITKEYKGESIVLICTLKGAVMWLSDLMRRIDLDTEVDFITVSSYGDSMTTTGKLEIVQDFRNDIRGKNVLIVEDIVDTGITLYNLKNYLMEQEPKSIKVCALLDKKDRRRIDVEADYVAFEVEDLFLIGYGLDFDQKYRNLPYITYIEEVSKE